MVYYTYALPSPQKVDCRAVFCVSKLPSDCKSGEIFVVRNEMQGICCDTCIKMV